MKLSRIDLVPVLAIVAGGVLGASLSFNLLGRSQLEADPVWVVDLPMIVQSTSEPAAAAPPATAGSYFWVEVPQRAGTGVRGIAAHLVREQHYIEASMKRLTETGEGASSDAGRLLFERKQAMHDEIADLEQEILRLSSEAQGERFEQLVAAASTIEEDKLKERVRYSRALIGEQDHEYTRAFEAETSRIVEELQEELGGSDMMGQGLLFSVRPRVSQENR